MPPNLLQERLLCSNSEKNPLSPLSLTSPFSQAKTQKAWPVVALEVKTSFKIAAKCIWPLVEYWLLVFKLYLFWSHSGVSFLMAIWPIIGWTICMVYIAHQDAYTKLHMIIFNLLTNGVTWHIGMSRALCAVDPGSMECSETEKAFLWMDGRVGLGIGTAIKKVSLFGKEFFYLFQSSSQLSHHPKSLHNFYQDLFVQRHYLGWVHVELKYLFLLHSRTRKFITSSFLALKWPIPGSKCENW